MGHMEANRSFPCSKQAGGLIAGGEVDFDLKQVELEGTSGPPRGHVPYAVLEVTPVCGEVARCKDKC